MRIRHLIASALILAVAAPGSATAAPKKKKAPPPPPPICNLLVDQKGDGYSVMGPAAKSDALDITGGDVATGKKEIVGVLRMVTTNATDNLSTLGMSWSLSFIVRGKTYTFKRTRYAGLTPTYVYTFAGLPVTTKVDGTTVTWRAPRSMVPELAKPKMMLENLAATSQWSSWNADAGNTQKKYPDQARSCVKAA